MASSSKRIRQTINLLARTTDDYEDYLPMITTKTVNRDDHKNYNYITQSRHDTRPDSHRLAASHNHVMIPAPTLTKLCNALNSGHDTHIPPRLSPTHHVTL
jgi:hypothetical protein